MEKKEEYGSHFVMPWISKTERSLMGCGTFLDSTFQRKNLQKVKELRTSLQEASKDKLDYEQQQWTILLEHGYLTEFRKLTENCKEQRSSLVRMPPQTGGLSLESSNDYENKYKKRMGRVGVEPTSPAIVIILINIFTFVSLDMAGSACRSIVSRVLAIIKGMLVSTVSLAVLVFRSVGCLETF